MKIRMLVLMATLLTAFVVPAAADEHAEDRKILLGMLDEFEAGLNKQDFDALLGYLHDDVVVTYYNAEVTRGHDEAREFYQRMLGSAGAVVREYSIEAEVGAPAVFHGDTAVAYGTTVENYKLAAGLDFTLDGRWSTTLQKIDGRWQVIALHFSTNLFDNPLLNNAARTTWIAAAVAFVVGALLVFVIGRVRARSG